MESKIRIKMGQIEIEYEGSEAFLKEELPSLLTAVSDLYHESGVPDETSNTSNTNNPSLPPKANIQITTGSLAAKLDVKSGTDLILAAAARMTLSLNMETFTRSKLIDEMKTASAYYKKSYVNNMSKYLNQLVKDQKLLETGSNTYALGAAEKSNIEAKLA